METARKKTGLIKQIAFLFALGVLITGLLTYFSQRAVADRTIRTQTESISENVSEEVRQALHEFPASEWLIEYWRDHADTMDIEYDVDYSSGTLTEHKVWKLVERHPDIQIKYATAPQVRAFNEEDQKLFAEVCYSWLITRINQIKAAYGMDFLFCVATDDAFDTQFFLFSAADPGAVRGKEYEQVYTLGVTVSVAGSQQENMRYACENSAHLADAGSYVDYYSYYGIVAGSHIMIGTTYDYSALKAGILAQTWRQAGMAMLLQLVLSLMILAIISTIVLKPLNKVLKSIHLYKDNKDSALVRDELASVSPRNEIGQLSEDFSGLATEMDDYMQRIKTNAAEKERMGAELELAARIQESMLPNHFPAFPDRADFKVYALMDPAREVGGDFYDFFLIDEDHLCLVIADVSGKGIPASLFMMASKIVISNNAMSGKTPAQILTDTNAAICSNNHAEMFVTVWLGILELSTGHLTAANAGHEYPVIKRPSGKYELLKDKHGFVIGGMEGIKYSQYEMDLEPGSKLFVYSDGLPEATAVDGAMYGTDRIVEALNAAPDLDPEGTILSVGESVAAFVGSAEQFDDLTMLAFEYIGQ